MGDLKEKISDYSVASRLHEEKCLEDDLLTANKLNSMNDKVTTIRIIIKYSRDIKIVLQILEIRQLVGVDALSKGKYYKLIKQNCPIAIEKIYTWIQNLLKQCEK